VLVTVVELACIGLVDARHWSSICLIVKLFTFRISHTGHRNRQLSRTPKGLNPALVDFVYIPLNTERNVGQKCCILSQRSTLTSVKQTKLSYVLSHVDLP